MTLIGITQRVVVDPAHGERRDALDQRWHRFLAAARISAIPLANNADLAQETADTIGVAGIILSGGDDLVEYGGDAPERDATERKLIAWARSRKVPILGVCRGMQAVQHFFGVRLRRGNGHVTPAHDIVADGMARTVNSYHNFMTTDTVPELEVWARAGDGEVEAIRHPKERIAGIMWHPERCSLFDSADIAYIAAFFGAQK